MKRYMKNILALILAVALLTGMVPAYAAVDTQTTGGGLISETGTAGDFALVADGKTATLWIDTAESAPVQRVVSDFKDDIKRVTGQTPSISKDITLPAGPVVLVGTLDNSAQIKALVETGKITSAEVDAIKGKWEAYLIKVVDPNTLAIVGSDPRGAVFGVYELSEQMGVSPWYYFADVPVQTKTSVYVKAGVSLTDKPDVQYRGIFINDEEKLSRWVTDVFNPTEGGSGVMGPKIYAKIFELILRLKGNYIWAAMHVNSINNIAGNIDLLHEYGIVLGSSHCDILLRTNVHEWENWKSANSKYSGASYDYTVSKDAVLQYWRENVIRHKDTEAQWTLGMRGAHDEPFNTANIKKAEFDYLLYGEDKLPGTADDVADTEDNRKALLMNEIIAEQQKILLEELGQDKYDKSFQALIPYKEVLPIYNNENFALPENVTIIWCDDNHGMVRRTPNEVERERAGGGGLYYHTSYWAPKDQSYLWMSSIPLSVMGEELNKCWETGIRKSWTLNVGDIKPIEGEMDYFIRCGWDVEKYTGASKEFSAEWMQRNFGAAMDEATRNEVADILSAFYQHTNVRKVDHMRLDIFEQSNYNEWDKRMAVYQDLYDRANAVAAGLNDAQRLGFYELVQCKINWAYLTNKAFYYAEESNLAYDQGRMASADAFSKLSIAVELERKAEIAKYDTMNGGKWRGFIDPENYAPPVTTQLPATNPALVLGAPAMGVVVQGEALPQENSKLAFSPYNQDGKFIDVFNKGSGSVAWTASADQPWVKLSATSGTVNDEIRLWVTIDGIEAHKGGTATITITGGNVTKTVTVQVESPALALSEIDGYAEADGYVSIQAEHYTEKKDAGQKAWQLIEDAGRGFDGDMMRTNDPGLGMVDGNNINAGTSPSLEYKFYLTSSGTFPIEVYRLPTMNAAPGGQIRFAVSVDGGDPILVSSTATDEGTTSQQNAQWAENLYRQIEKHVVMLPELSSGAHTLKLWMVDNLIAIDKMVIYTNATKDTIPPSALGPDESYHSVHKKTFTASVPTMARTSTPAEPKDIPATWGSGAFLEQDGVVALEAEYAMENVLASKDEITSDMNAYTVSKWAEAAKVAGKTPNAWRLTQSDTGLAMRLPDLNAQWTEGPEFPPYSPELTYKINFSNTGTYKVWVRWRYVDDGSDSIRGGLNNVYTGSFSTAAHYSNNLDEKWHWKELGTVAVTQAGVQPFSLWMREDGLYLDRIYLTKGSETPGDGTWQVSFRGGATEADILARNLKAKKEEINKISYPVGNSVGLYNKSAYDAMMGKIKDAEALAASGTVTAEQAAAALKAIDDAREALGKTLNLTGQGITYNAFRDFEHDTVGRLPYGFTVEALTNGATAAILEENGNKFLRTTSSSAGNSAANLFLPFAGEVVNTASQRVVVEFRTRFQAGCWYANAAMLRNNDPGTSYSMVVAYDNGSGLTNHGLFVQDGTAKKNVLKFTDDTWYSVKMVGDWTTKKYTVYVDGVAVATNFTFRDSTKGSKLTGHFFGVDNKPNGVLDMDDFRVSVIDATTVTPISGTVAIGGTAQWGQTLTADVSGVPEAARPTLQYVWASEDGVQVGTGSTYMPTRDDVGKTLTLTVHGTGAFIGGLSSTATEAVDDADNSHGEALKLFVDGERAKVDKLSIPVGSGLGCYGYAEYRALIDALDTAEALTAAAPSEEAATAAEQTVNTAWTALNGSLNLAEDAITYNAYRDFSSDALGKLPYGITATLANGGAAQIVEENGNRFLRLTTTSASGSKADMLLPYIGQVTATGNQRVVIEYRARFKEGCQYSNICLPNNQANQITMAVAFENASNQHNIMVQNGPNDKLKIQPFNYSVWYSFKMVVNLDAQTYDVYMSGEVDGQRLDNKLIASGYKFRSATPATNLVSHRFGPDKTNGQVDFDDFKVSVVTPAAANDITAVAAVADKKVAPGTAVGAVGLPETVAVTLGDGSTKELGVAWASTDYNANAAGTYTFTGTLTLADGTTNTKNLAATAKVTVSKIKVATVGDSITYGSNGSGGAVAEAEKYPSQLQTLLGNNYEVKNFGVSGATMINEGTDSGGAKKGYIQQAKYTESLDFQPDIVVIMLGTNDSKALNWDGHKAEYVDDALALIQSYENLPSHPTVYVAASPTVVEGSNSYGIQVDVVHNEIVPLQKQIALSKDGGFIDVHEATKDATTAQFPDRVHGNKDGYQLIADAVHGALTAAVMPKAAPITTVEETTATVAAGSQPVLPGFVAVTYADGKTGVAAVTWNLSGLSFDTAGTTVDVPGTLKGLSTTAAAKVTVTNEQHARLQAAVDAKRAELNTLSYPLGSGVGCYSQTAYDALLQALSSAEALAGEDEITTEQANTALAAMTAAETALNNSLNLTDGSITYNAYRDFSNDTVGKLPYGIEATKVTNGGAAQIEEENGNKFLRLTTGSSKGYANMFLPYVGEVTASADQRVVIEYSARFNSELQYANACQPRDEKGGLAMSVAFENAASAAQIKVNDGSTKKNVKAFSYSTWYDFKIVADMKKETYTVYMDDAVIAENFTFRTKGGEYLTGHIFGIDNFANGQVDFDDIKVSVADVSGAPDEITGNISITGNAVYSETLTADVSKVTPAAAQNGLAYAWIRDGQTVSTTNSYKLGENDIGFTITLTVSGTDGYTGELTAATGPVQKAGQAAPEGLTGQKPTGEGLADGKILGLSSEKTYEYKDVSDEGDQWTALAGETELAAGTYQVRYVGTATHNPGTPVVVEILPYDAPEKAPTPTTARFDVVTMTLSGVDATMEYSVDGGESWMPITEESVDLSDADLTAEDSILVRVAVSEEHSASDPQTITLTQAARPTGLSGKAPTSENGADGKILGLAAEVDYEYREEGQGDWTPLTGATGLAAGTYQVRVAAKGTAFASEALSVNVPAYVPTTPNDSGDSDIKTTTRNNEDGSTTRTVTNLRTGTVTETTTWPNGDKRVVKTEKSGTVTETVTKSDGSRSETVIKPDGSLTAVMTDARGVKVERVTDPDGETTAKITLPSDVSKARITLPVEGASASTVAVLVRADGTEEIIRTSILTEDGITFFAEGDMAVKLVDNESTFSDVADGHWASDAIAFTASRELFVGIGEGAFAPNLSMSRAMLFTVMARLDGADTVGGATWYSKAMEWAVEAGISDGSAPETAITREQLAAMLYRYAGQPAAEGESKTFADSGDVSDWAGAAMDWAVKTGILTGKTGDRLDPDGFASRAEVSAMLMRFVALTNQA